MLRKPRLGPKHSRRAPHTLGSMRALRGLDTGRALRQPRFLTLKDEKQGPHFPWPFCGAMALASDHTSMTHSWRGAHEAEPQGELPLVTAQGARCTGHRETDSTFSSCTPAAGSHWVYTVKACTKKGKENSATQADARDLGKLMHSTSAPPVPWCC